ncbi:cyclic nucleotide-binding domain-containing protein [Candidatus Peregrinibacteria bacterium]|jgi:CRP-like cAMP-binding protein|nr:cyclic nucleotide-binding domain-containing protein [Candidatus Peregrinibacteria bacterium]
MNDYNSIIPLLQGVPLFRELNEEEHKAIIDNITMMYYPAQYRIFSKGDVGDALYIIKTGSAKVFDEQGEIAVLKPYEFFGEMALFKDLPRNASVETLEETEVVILKKEDFFKLIASDENIGRLLSEEYFLRESENKQRAEGGAA